MASFESGSYFFPRARKGPFSTRTSAILVLPAIEQFKLSLSLVRWKVGRLGKSAVVHLFVWVEFFSELGGFHWTRISIQFRPRCTSVSVLGRFRRNKFSFQNWLLSPAVRGGGGGGEGTFNWVQFPGTRGCRFYWKVNPGEEDAPRDFEARFDFFRAAFRSPVAGTMGPSTPSGEALHGRERERERRLLCGCSGDRE